MAISTFGTHLATLGLGAALSYFFDPIQGRRRRVVARDRAASLLRDERELLDKAGRDLSNRAHGLAERVRGSRHDADDRMIAERVKARLGHLVVNPSAITCEVAGGRLRLRGPVLERERRRLIRHARRVPGVRGVVDELEPRATTEGLPGARGNGEPRGRSAWSPAARLVAVAAGGGAIAYAIGARRGLGSVAAAVGGAALIARAAANEPLPRALGAGGGHTVEIQKTITLDAPVERVFALWSRVEAFPRFMQHVREVEVTDRQGRRARWTVDGPTGTPVTFEVELTRLEPERVVAWRTIRGEPFEHEGTVHFEPADGGTRVHIQMRYAPRAGAVGHGVARLFGWDPKHRLDDDLVRVKSLLERGFTTAHGARVTLDEVAFKS